jgi:hypothetical protein
MNVGFDAGVYFVCTWASFEALLIYVDPLRLQLSQQARIMSVVLLPSFFFFFSCFFYRLLFCFVLLVMEESCRFKRIPFLKYH